MDAEVSTQTFLTMIIEESVCFMSCEPFYFCVTQDLNSFSGRLSLMHTVQLMKKMLDASKNIFRVYHIIIIAPKKKWFTRHETDRILNNDGLQHYLWFLFLLDILSNITPVLGEDIFSLKIQFGIRRYLY
jgi:hypothetical protein